jgi:hypothetical protein
MSEIVGFIKDNIISIVIIVVSVLLFLAILKIKEIDLNPPKPESKLVQQVIVETLDTMDNSLLDENINLNPVQSFCESYLGNSIELEGACNDLTESNCATAKCCVYTGEKCVAGNKDGPKYKTDNDGKLLTIDSYYYLGKCCGVSCPT